MGRILEATVNSELKDRFYANSVIGNDGGFIETTDTYKVVSLYVNCGVVFSRHNDSPETKKFEEEFRAALPFVDGTMLTVESPDRSILFYTVDLAPITPDGWDIRAEKISDKKPFSFGIIMTKPGHSHDADGAHRFVPTDFRPAGADICPSIGKNYFYPEGKQCQREADHLGYHEAIDEDGTFHEWEVDGHLGHTTPHGKFGFRNACPYCGFVLPGGQSGNKVCFACAYWIQQKDVSGSFVIDGTHYRPGRGGYGGRIWNIQRIDGTMWKGELFCQGRIPVHFRAFFPDNAQFIESPKIDWEKELGI